MKTRNAARQHNNNDEDDNVEEEEDDSDDSTVRDRILPRGQHTAERVLNKRRIPDDDDFENNNDGDDDDDDDFEQEEEEEYNSEKDNDEDFEENESNDDDDNYSSSPTKKNKNVKPKSSRHVQKTLHNSQRSSGKRQSQATKKWSSPRRRRRRMTRQSMAESSSSNDDDSNEDDISKRNKSRHKKSNSKSNSGDSSFDQDEQFEDNDDDDDDESFHRNKHVATKTTRTNSSVLERIGRSGNKRKRSNAPTTTTTTTMSPRKQRSSARRAKLALAKHAADESDHLGDSDISLEKSFKRSKAADDDDDDYDFVDDQDEEIENADLEEDDDDEFEPRKRSSRRQTRSGDLSLDEYEEDGVLLDDSAQWPATNIDLEKLGDTDESSDHDLPTPRKSNQLFEEISPRIHRKKQQHKQQDDDDDDSDWSSQHLNENNNKLSTVSQLLECPSTHDSITFAELPTRHVCFITSDGSRNCFALSTLHKIATTMSNMKRFRTDNLGVQKQTFLQPPHFRSAMSDDLLDQIASRFGREALDIEGGIFYHDLLPEIENNGGGTTKEEKNDGDDKDLEEKRPLSRALIDNEEFLEMVQRYVKTQMGNQDLYVCPLCFSIAQARYCGDTESNNNDSHHHHKKTTKKNQDEQLREKYLTENALGDPMAILKSLDRNWARELEIASTFCRKRVSEIKVHIRLYHGLDTKNIEGNTLYARYKIRDQDGLLQRYLGMNNHFSQGAMMSYWFRGYNFDFVHLLTLVERAQILEDIQNAQDEEVESHEKEEAQDYWAAARQFFNSFSQIASSLWDLLAGPHRSGPDLDDFLDNDPPNDDPDDNDERLLHMALDSETLQNHRSQEAEESRKLAEDYEQRALEVEDYELDQDSSSFDANLFDEDDDDDNSNSDPTSSRGRRPKGLLPLSSPVATNNKRRRIVLEEDELENGGLDV